MKLNLKNMMGLMFAAGISLSIGMGVSSCTDTVKFGSNFVEMPPGGDVNFDTVFSNAEYTRQYLASIYARQFYNLPSRSTNDPPQCWNYWKGMVDALGDDYQLFFNNTEIFSQYYMGSMSSSGSGAYPFLREYIWENVRHCWVLINNVDRVPGLDDAEKAQMKDEARCLMAYTYFNTFRYYGGLPLVTGTFSGAESSYNMPRASVEKTVNFMVAKLDSVISGNHLPWGYTDADAVAQTGRWTKAGAMALKIKILQFAASPLFNADKPYYSGKYTIDNDSVAWYGGYKPELWTKYRQACKDFFDQMTANGIYHLVVPSANTQEAYRYAFRSSYLLEGSSEVLQSFRVAATTHGNDYQWFNLRNNDRLSYSPTQEFVEMFPWADGTPFNWDQAAKDGKLDQMFVKGDTVANQQYLQNRKYTRDPRLYETVGCNGGLQTINWGDGRTSGANWEMWVGGSDAGNGPLTNTGLYATGYRNLRYIAGDAYDRKYPQWVPLLLSDIYLSYAEALIQADNNLTEAIKYIDAVRARVGLKGLVECNPSKNLTTNKQALMDELLRERCCELALQNSRYFDMIRYKRADLFERTLHGLRIYRLVKNSSGAWERSTTQWYKSDRTKAKSGTPAWYEPSHFDFEKFEITTGARVWWSKGFDPKWYLQPFPLTEINKGYGLIQNAGW